MSTLTRGDVVSELGDDAPPSARSAARPARSAARELVEGDFLDLLFDKVWTVPASVDTVFESRPIHRE